MRESRRSREGAIQPLISLFRASSRSRPHRPRHGAVGQSVVEFAIVAPVMILMVVAIADLGRVYTSAVAVEAAAREAADYGSFQASNWSTTPTDNRSTTLA